MKNPGTYCLLLVCCISLAFIGGFFVGRNANHSPVILSTAAVSAPAKATGPAATPSAQVDINTATAAELEQLPGIGATLARRIVDYRDIHGSFTSVSELLNVEGIGAQKLEAIIDYVIAGG